MGKNIESPKSRLVVLLLCIFVGYLGIHRFYVGKTGKGILWLFTGGICGIGQLVDLIMIIIDSFTDVKGNFVINYDAYLKQYRNPAHIYEQGFPII